MKSMKLMSWFLFVCVFIAISIVTACTNRKGVEKAEKIWREYQPTKINNLGTTKSLSILPLVEWQTSQPDLMRESGVSYLIKTDRQTILFDVGFNEDEMDISPLQHNMKMLGVTTQDFDTIIISHNHPDHVGGFGWMEQKTFSMGNEQIDLTGKRAFTPIPMSYPGIDPIYVREPTIIGPGVATLGTIPRQLFLLGLVEEQALAVNVEGKGIVLIVGCGHQTVSKILQRFKQVFSEPVYAIVGGLHYPVPSGRMRKFGIDIQTIVSTESPFNPIKMKDVFADIERLKALKLGLIGLSAHDSSDQAIEVFRQSFGTTFRDLRVGEWTIIGNEDPLKE